MEKEKMELLILKQKELNLSKHFVGTSIIKVKSSSELVLRKKGTQISKLKMLNVEATLVDMSTTILKTASLLGKDIDAGIVPTICEMICDKFYFLKIEEFELAMKRGVLGEYGKIPFNATLPANLIFEWLTSYNSTEGFITAYEQKADDYKKEESKGRNTSVLELPQFLEKMKEAGVMDNKSIYESTEEEKEAHRQMIIKQREEILKKD